MVFRRGLVAVVFGVSIASTSMLACKKEPEVVRAQVKPGNMPAEGNWRGVYYSPLYGYLHLQKDGSSVSGKWRTAAGDKWGELAGKVEGDVLRFEWKEHRIGMFGPNATTEGKGYFRYIVPEEDNADHELHGEWGLGDNEAGNPWKTIKQRDMEPDPDSVMPDEAQSQFKGGDWDGSKSDQAAGAKDEPKNETKKDPDTEGWDE